MNITVENVESNTSDGTITVVHWRASIADGIYTAEAYGSVVFNRGEGSPALIPFTDVTEANVVAWVTESLDENLEVSLLANIELQKNPVSMKGKPWELYRTVTENN
jgi:hypothetical protein